MRALTTVILVLVSFNLFGQLSNKAKVLKEKSPEAYEVIKENAIEEWKDNHEMIVYDINGQAEAIFKFLGLRKDPGYDKDIMFESLVEWKDDDYDILSAMSNSKTTQDILEFDVNWEMVVYTYKNQLEAKSQY